MLSNLHVSKNILTPEAVSVILSIISLFSINTPTKSKSIPWDAILLWSKRQPDPFLTSDTWLWQSSARLRQKFKWRNTESAAKYNKYANLSFQKPIPGHLIMSPYFFMLLFSLLQWEEAASAAALFCLPTCLHLLYGCLGNPAENNACVSHLVDYMSKSNLNQRVTNLIDGDGSIQKQPKKLMLCKLHIYCSWICEHILVCLDRIQIIFWTARHIT